MIFLPRGVGSAAAGLLLLAASANTTGSGKAALRGEGPTGEGPTPINPLKVLGTRASLAPEIAGSVVDSRDLLDITNSTANPQLIRYGTELSLFNK